MIQRMRLPTMPGRGLPVLLAQLSVFLIVPFADTSEARAHLAPTIVVLLLAILSTWLVAGWRWGVPLLLLGLLATALSSSEVGLHQTDKLAPGMVMIAIFGLAAAGVASAAFGTSVRGIERIYCGAASFILLGFAFAVVHSRIGFWSPDSYALNHDIEGTRHLHWADFLWLSFSTITTAGFADVTPVSSWARVVTSFEGLVGILFPATFLARIVSLPAEKSAHQRQES